MKNMFEAAFNESLTKEELKGNQKKLDVAPPYGRLTGDDFKKLRAGKKKIDKEGAGIMHFKKDQAIKKGEDSFEVGGKEFPVKENFGLDAEARRRPNSAPEPAPEPSDSDVWAKSLDKGTEPGDFDAAQNPALKLDTEGVQKAREWIKKLEDMATFINGMDENSLNSQINALEMRNSIPFKGIVRRKEKQITDIAEKLRALAELFKTVVTGSQKKLINAR